MTKSEKSSELSEAALALDHELRRFEELSEQAAKLKLNTEKGLERATDALARAAQSQDRMSAMVQKLVEAVAAAPAGRSPPRDPASLPACRPGSAPRARRWSGPSPCRAPVPWW